MLGVFYVCCTLEKDSRHAGSVLCLLYLSEGFKACWESFLEPIELETPFR